MAKSEDTPHHFESLKAHHDLSRFECELQVLTNYLKNDALRDQQRNHARTYLCIDEGAEREVAVIGYFTLRASSYYIGLTYYIPTIEIAALARHQDRHGEDWGNVLLSEALSLAVDAANIIGVTGIQLTSSDQGRKLYHEAGFSEHPVLPGYLFLAINKIPTL
jgi:GNAT superfamily N-acetyltransferase